MIFDILVFTQFKKSYAPNRIVSQALDLNLKAKVIEYSEVDINSIPEARSVVLRSINVDSLDHFKKELLLKYFSSKGVFILNKDSLKTWSELDKKDQLSEFKKGDISHLSDVGLDHFNYPLIAKHKNGSHGDFVFKLEKFEDLKKVLSKYKKEDLIFQEYLKSGFDLRAIVLGTKVLSIMKRTPKEGNFLSNYSQGGIVEKYQARDYDKVAKLALKTASHFKLEYAGIDLMLDNQGRWIVLEVNRACQFEGFEKVTKVNVALEIVKYLKEKIEER